MTCDWKLPKDYFRVWVRTQWKSAQTENSKSHLLCVFSVLFYSKSHPDILGNSELLLPPVKLKLLFLSVYDVVVVLLLEHPESFSGFSHSGLGETSHSASVVEASLERDAMHQYASLRVAA